MAKVDVWSVVECKSDLIGLITAADQSEHGEYSMRAYHTLTQVVYTFASVARPSSSKRSVMFAGSAYAEAENATAATIARIRETIVDIHLDLGR